MIHLNLGSYKHLLSGYVNLDKTCTKADIVMPMEDYVPEEKIVVVNAKCTLGFLDEPTKMIRKIIQEWLSDFGEFHFEVREKSLVEEYLLKHPEIRPDKIRKGQMKYGAGIIRKHLFSEKKVGEELSKLDVQFRIQKSRPNIVVSVFRLPKMFTAERIIWVTGESNTGKSSLLHNLIGGTNDKKIYHELSGGVCVVGRYGKNKHMRGIENYPTWERKLRIKIAAGFAKTVVFESAPWRKDEYLDLKKWAEENKISFDTIVLVAKNETCLKRAAERKDSKSRMNGQKIASKHARNLEKFVPICIQADTIEEKVLAKFRKLL